MEPVKDKCMIGFSDLEYNKLGDCCCNCKVRLTITGHPWANGESISTSTGEYACGSALLHGEDGMRQAFLLSGPKIPKEMHGHGMCEEHIRVSVEVKEREIDFYAGRHLRKERVKADKTDPNSGRQERLRMSAKDLFDDAGVQHANENSEKNHCPKRIGCSHKDIDEETGRCKDCGLNTSEYCSYPLYQKEQ